MSSIDLLMLAFIGAGLATMLGAYFGTRVLKWLQDRSDKRE